MKSVRLPLVAIDFFLQTRGKRNSCSSPDPLPAIEEIFCITQNCHFALYELFSQLTTFTKYFLFD